jgi:crotonobetainyl-CoA:carnitine CoA-transferase CaiB-like acyl-CoA transferase
MVPEVVAEVKAAIRTEIEKKTFAEWNAIFGALDCCVEPVLTFAEACEHPHIKARGLVVDVPKPDGGTQKQLGSAIKFSKTQPEFKFIGVAIGANTDEVLKAQGVSDERVTALRQAGVIA